MEELREDRDVNSLGRTPFDVPVRFAVDDLNSGYRRWDGKFLSQRSDLEAEGGSVDWVDSEGVESEGEEGRAEGEEGK